MNPKKLRSKNPNIRTEKAKREATSTLVQSPDSASATYKLVKKPKLKLTKGAIVARIAVVLLSLLSFLVFIASIGWYLIDWFDMAQAGYIPLGVTLNGSSLEGMDADEVDKTVNALIAENFAQAFTVIAERESADTRVGDYVSSDADALIYAITKVRMQTSLWDRIRHDYLDESIESEFETSYLIDSEAVEAFATQVAKLNDRSPKNASLYFEGFTPVITEARTGYSIDIEQTAARMEAAIVKSLEGDGIADVEVSAETLEPTILRKQLMEPVLTVNIGARQVMLWNGDELVKTYTCAVGQPAYPTIPGEYYIGVKQVNPAWTNPDPNGWGKGMPKTIPGPNDALGVRGLHIYTLDGWDSMMLFHGALGGGLGGTATTHGCIRMFNGDVIDLYDRVPTGTRVSLAY
jgi:hypothetical protein